MINQLLSGKEKIDWQYWFLGMDANLASLAGVVTVALDTIHGNMATNASLLAGLDEPVGAMFVLFAAFGILAGIYIRYADGPDGWRSNTMGWFSTAIGFGTLGTVAVLYI